MSKNFLRRTRESKNHCYVVMISKYRMMRHIDETDNEIGNSLKGTRTIDYSRSDGSAYLALRSVTSFPVAQAMPR
jgi:hypothetical protein